MSSNLISSNFRYFNDRQEERKRFSFLHWSLAGPHDLWNQTLLDQLISVSTCFDACIVEKLRSAPRLARLRHSLLRCHWLCQRSTSLGAKLAIGTIPGILDPQPCGRFGGSAYFWGVCLRGIIISVSLEWLVFGMLDLQLFSRFSYS